MAAARYASGIPKGNCILPGSLTLPTLPTLPNRLSMSPRRGWSTHVLDLPTAWMETRPRLGVTHALSRGSGRNRKDEEKTFFLPSHPAAWSHCGSPPRLARCPATAALFPQTLLWPSCLPSCLPPRVFRPQRDRTLPGNIAPCSRVCAPCPSPTPRPTLGAHPHLYFLPQGRRPCGPAARSSHIEHTASTAAFSPLGFCPTHNGGGTTTILRMAIAIAIAMSKRESGLKLHLQHAFGSSKRYE